MRSVLSVTLCLLLGGLSSTAQQGTAVHAFLGACTGAPIPVGNVPEGASGSPQLGFVGGVGLDVPLATEWTFHVEPQYVRYGATFNTPLTNQPYIDKVLVTTPDGSTTILEIETTFTGTATGTFDTEYFQVPLLVRYTLSPTWGVLAGGYVGWMVATRSNATGVGQVGIRPETVERNLEFGERMEGVDHGVQVGAQWQVFDDLRLNMRGVYGLSSIFSEDFRTVDRTVHNLFVHVTLGFRLL